MHELKEKIQEYWNDVPCGWTHSFAPKGSKKFFKEVEEHRYFVEPHIHEVAQFTRHKGKKVLEIGVGLGTDHRHFAANGAITIGIDLTAKAVQMTRKRLRLYGLVDRLCNADAERLPFKDNSFDVVYSFGVLLSVPRTDVAIEEIRRVLRPGGTAIIMLYNKWSVKYLYDILFKKGILKGELLHCSPIDVLGQHSEANPGSPLIKAYTNRVCRTLFANYQTMEIKKYYIYKWREPEYKKKRYVPRFLYRTLSPRVFSWLEGKLGWHMVITAKA